MMRKNIISVISIFICFLGIVSCNNTLLPIRIPTGEPAIPQNDITKEIPRYEENNKVYLYYKLAKQKQKQLNLIVPENGYDSLLLRLWFVYPDNFHQFGEMLEIRYTSNLEKEAQYTRMRVFFNPTRDWEQINTHKDSTIVAPKNGWLNWSDTLKHLNILRLPTIEHIPEYKERVIGLGYDNSNLTVACEIATKDSYRFIQYNDFEKHKDIDEVARMYQFIRFLRSEFNMMNIDEEWYGK